MKTIEELVNLVQTNDDSRPPFGQAGWQHRPKVKLLPVDIPFEEIKLTNTFPNANKASHYIDLHEDIMCLDCMGTLAYCKHNPHRKHTTEEMNALYPVVNPIKLSDDVVTRTRKARGVHTVITNDMKDDFISGYRAGDTIQVLAARFNVLPLEISTILKSSGIEIRKGRVKGTVVKKEITSSLIKMWVSQYKAGKNITELSKEYNFPSGVISEELRKENVTLRPRGRVKGSIVKSNRVKSVLDIDKTIILQAKKLMKTMGVVASAKELNVNPNELSKALKAEGIVITRGRKKIK